MHFELTREYIDSLRNVIAKNNEPTTNLLLRDLHAADIANLYKEISLEDAKYIFMLLDKEKAADVVSLLEEDERMQFLKSLPGEIIASQFIDEMDSDDAADVLSQLPEDKKEDIFRHITDLDQAGNILDLLAYDEDTAGGLMAKELIAVNKNLDVNSCLTDIRLQAEEIDELYFVYVVDDNKKLVGTLSLKRIILAKSSAKVEDIHNPDVISVKTETRREEVAHIMEKYDLVSLPVIDRIGRLVGRITIDDVVDVIREEAEKDYQMISGISQDVEPGDSVWLLIRARLPWLLVGLVGGTMGAWVMSGYEADIGKWPKLAFFAPLVAAMGGNAGVQSSSIIVQALANNTIGLESPGRKWMKELIIAFFNALVLSSLIIAIITIFVKDIPLTITVSASLFIVIVCASLFGTFIPLALNKFKIDPALATGPFITTFNDIMGLFIYFAFGRIISGMF